MPVMKLLKIDPEQSDWNKQNIMSLILVKSIRV